MTFLSWLLLCLTKIELFDTFKVELTSFLYPARACGLNGLVQLKDERVIIYG
jgi:hypothetical protein